MARQQKHGNWIGFSHGKLYKHGLNEYKNTKRDILFEKFEKLYMQHINPEEGNVSCVTLSFICNELYIRALCDSCSSRFLCVIYFHFSS